MASIKNYEKYKHLIGTHVNNWNILDIICEESKHHVFALAKCHCGTTKEVRLTYLLNNKQLDCGCGRKDRQYEKIKKQYEYLLNTSINGWAILEIIPSGKMYDHTYVTCKCKCGTVKDVRLDYILNERSKDCGCGRKETLHEIFTKDIIGKRFGKLVVQEMLDERSKQGKIIYRCACDCGSKVNVIGNSLTTYHTLSCGCLNSYWNMYITQFLEKSNLNFKPEHTVYIEDKYYRFDFYLPDYNLFIEYDGQQHYEPVRFHGNNVAKNEYTFKKIKEHDQIKNKYCEENNINLLRIPYWESKKIETVINSCLQRLSEKGFAA